MEPTARAWSDLAVAYTAQAQNGQRDFDYIQALEAANRATTLAPEHAISLYNLALAQENLHLRTVASKTWERFLDTAPGYRQEVEERLERLSRARPMDAWDEGVKDQVLALATGGDVEPLRPYARSFAPSIRSLIERELLVGWARLATAGDLAAAGSKLDQARHLARALADEAGQAKKRPTLLQGELGAEGSSPRFGLAGLSEIAEIAAWSPRYGRSQHEKPSLCVGVDGTGCTSPGCLTSSFKKPRGRSTNEHCYQGSARWGVG